MERGAQGEGSFELHYWPIGVILTKRYDVPYNYPNCGHIVVFSVHCAIHFRRKRGIYGLPVTGTPYPVTELTPMDVIVF